MIGDGIGQNCQNWLSKIVKIDREMGNIDRERGKIDREVGKIVRRKIPNLDKWLNYFSSLMVFSSMSEPITFEAGGSLTNCTGADTPGSTHYWMAS